MRREKNYSGLKGFVLKREKDRDNYNVTIRALPLLKPLLQTCDMRLGI
jgi:hypothetical protein